MDDVIECEMVPSWCDDATTETSGKIERNSTDLADPKANSSAGFTAHRSDFRRWFEAGFGSELVPIIPPGAELHRQSTIDRGMLGKIPGKWTLNGWYGFKGWQELSPTVADLKEWQAWGAGVGMQGRNFPAIDVDISDPILADEVSALIRKCLGAGPVRTRKNSPRRLHMFRLAYGSEPLRKKRLAFCDKNGVKHAVELLGMGQQYVVEGLHPSGVPYQWDEHLRSDDLPGIGAFSIGKVFGHA
jgi:hypothetical protein